MLTPQLKWILIFCHLLGAFKSCLSGLQEGGQSLVELEWLTVKFDRCEAVVTDVFLVHLEQIKSALGVKVLDDLDVKAWR